MLPCKRFPPLICVPSGLGEICWNHEFSRHIRNKVVLRVEILPRPDASRGCHTTFFASFAFFGLSATCWKVKPDRSRSVMHGPQLTEKQQIEWKFQLPCGLQMEAARTQFEVKKSFFLWKPRLTLKDCLASKSCEKNDFRQFSSHRPPKMHWGRLGGLPLRNIVKIWSGYGCKFCVRKSGKNVNLIEFLSKKFSDDFSKIFWKKVF